MTKGATEKDRPPIVISDRSRAGREFTLTENEGTLLGLVMRNQPVTAYQLFKMSETSPVGAFNSKGALYPVIGRLRDRGYLTAKRVRGDGRGTEALSCTNAGVAALKAWVKGLHGGLTLMYDPIRTRMISLDLLSKDERLEWVVDAKRLVDAKKEEVAQYAASVDLPYGNAVHSAAKAVLEAISGSLDELMYEIVKGPSPG